jgi:hypothetical protein
MAWAGATAAASGVLAGIRIRRRGKLQGVAEAAELPPAAAGSNRAIYFFQGDGLKVGPRAVPSRVAVRLRGDASVELANGATPGEILLLQGRPIGEPVVAHGPFVMNTQSEIRQAFADYQRTRFGGWPWPSDEPVHGPEPTRFARHADGREERRG